MRTQKQVVPTEQQVLVIARKTQESPQAIEGLLTIWFGGAPLPEVVS